MKEAAHRIIKFVDDRILIAEGSDMVVLRDSDQRKVVINEVLYVPRLKTNLFSLGQQL